MAYIITSVVLVIAYTFFLAFALIKGRPSVSGHMAGTAFIRLSVFILLSALPFMSLAAGMLGRFDLARYAEACPPVISMAIALLGLIFIAQKSLALMFGMKPGFSTVESGFLIILAAVMYAGYMFDTFAGVYYLGPGLYALFLIIRGRRGAGASAEL